MSDAEAGWYPDPHNAQQLRYFDGIQWTEHYHPLEQQAPPNQAAAAPGQYPAATAAGGGFLSSGSVPAPAHVAPPTSAGGLLAAAFQGVKDRWAPVLGLGIAFVIAAAAMNVALIFVVSTRLFGSGFDSVGGAFVSVFIGGLVISLVIGLMYTVLSMMVSEIYLQFHRGQPHSLGAAWAKTKSRVWSTFGLFIVLYIAQGIGSAIFGGILGSILRGADAVFLIIYVTVALTLLVKVWGFLFLAGVDTQRGQSILERSMSVSNGRFFPVLGRVILVSLPLVGTYALFLWAFLSRDPFGSFGPSSTTTFLLFVVVAILGAAGWTIYQSGLARIYAETDHTFGF